MSHVAQLQAALSLSLEASVILRQLGVALLCGLVIAAFYVQVVGVSTHARSFVASLVVLALIVAVAIMVIGNNLARAFGLVGAMSIVRFRTAVKDVQDIVFIFFSLVIGLAAGVGLSVLACVGTGVIGVVLVLITTAQRHLQRRRDFLLQLEYQPGAAGEAAYLPALERFCQRHHLISVRTGGEEEPLDLSFSVRLRDAGRSAALLGALAQAQGVTSANLFLDEEYVG